MITDIVDRLLMSLQVNPAYLLRNADIAEAANEIKRLRAVLKVAAQWVPLPGQAYTPDARRDAEIVQAALTITEEPET